MQGAGVAMSRSQHARGCAPGRSSERVTVQKSCFSVGSRSGCKLKEDMPVESLKTVLVVEDDWSIQSLIALVLEEQGYRVETAANGRQGLDLFEQCSPDLILLDMNMPVMNGWEFARELHAKHDSQVPIVVVTASCDARRAAADIGAAGCIGKPFELEALLSAVNQLLATP